MPSAALLVACLLAAKPAAPADVDRYIDVCGLRKQLAQTPELVIAGFDQAIARSATGITVDPRYLAGLKGAIPDVYGAERVVAEVRTYLLKNVDAGALRQTLDWYTSPLALKVTALEVEFSTVEAYAEIQKYAATLRASPPPAERLKLVRALDRAVRGTETALDMMVGTVRGMLVASQALEPRGKRPDALKMAQTLEGVRESNRPGTEQLGLVSMLYTYRSLTDAELGQYVAFFESPAGSAVGTKTGEGLNAAFARLAVDLGDISASLVAKFPPRR